MSGETRDNHPTRDPEEVDVYTALHLEAYTSEDPAELFSRACRVLREHGIRVKAGSATAETSTVVAQELYPL